MPRRVVGALVDHSLDQVADDPPATRHYGKLGIEGLMPISALTLVAVEPAVPRVCTASFLLGCPPFARGKAMPLVSSSAGRGSDGAAVAC
jgi:hypothetical protein